MRKVAVLIVLVVLIIVGLGWWNHGNAPVNPQDKSEKVFVVEKGAGVRAVASNLKKEGLINDPIAFFILVKKEGKDNAIQAGDYKLSPSMNLQKILDSLSHGTVDIWVTIPEGMRADEIADALQKKIPSYEEVWRTELEAEEGKLFPDTYLIPRDATIETVLSIFKTNFDKKIREAGITPEDATLEKTLTIASLIEREALFDSDRMLVSSVIHNRLKIGMKLDIDASVQYGLGKQPNGSWWKKNLTPADLELDSPYNLYTSPGLPPTPISNPGLTSINAALNPSSTNYLYYVSDKKGHLHFAETFSQHQQNIAKYL
ncbi:MAG: endolytic transglycosylase MltG [Candidatus Levyibacteriota bacterium]